MRTGALLDSRWAGRKVLLDGMPGYLVLHGKYKVAFRPENKRLSDMAIFSYDELEVIE